MSGLAAALCCGACGEITAFCLQAGAPDGVRLEVTTRQTPDGFRIECGTGVVSDSLSGLHAAGDSAAAEPDSTTRIEPS